MFRRPLPALVLVVSLALVGCTKTSIGNAIDPDAALVKGHKQMKVETGVYSDLLVANIDGKLAEKVALQEWEEKGDYTVGSARLFDAYVPPGDHCFIFRWAAHRQSTSGTTRTAANPVVEEALSKTICFEALPAATYQVHHRWDRPAPGEQGKAAHFFWVTDADGVLVGGERPSGE